MRYSRDDLTLSVTIYSLSILFQNHPQKNLKRKFHEFLNSHFLDLQCFNSISESFSEKHKEEISWFSYTTNVNKKKLYMLTQAGFELTSSNQ